MSCSDLAQAAGPRPVSFDRRVACILARSQRTLPARSLDESAASTRADKRRTSAVSPFMWASCTMCTIGSATSGPARPSPSLAAESSAQPRRNASSARANGSGTPASAPQWRSGRHPARTRFPAGRIAATASLHRSNIPGAFVHCPWTAASSARSGSLRRLECFREIRAPSCRSASVPPQAAARNRSTPPART